LVQHARLGATDEKDPTRNGTYCKVYTYPMRAGQLYFIDLRSTNFDAYLRLEDSTGRQLAEDDDGGGGLNARIVFMAPRSDTFRIIATTFAPGMVGDYTLTIRP
jgi:hypothetical protein